METKSTSTFTSINYRGYSITVHDRNSQLIINFSGEQKIEPISTDSVITAIRCAKDCIDSASWKYFTTVDGYKISVRYNINDKGFEFQALKNESPTLNGKNFSFYPEAVAAAIKFIETEKTRG